MKPKLRYQLPRQPGLKADRTFEIHAQFRKQFRYVAVTTRLAQRAQFLRVRLTEHSGSKKLRLVGKAAKPSAIFRENRQLVEKAGFLRDLNRRAGDHDIAGDHR